MTNEQLLIELAKTKAKNLPVNSQIRLTPEPNSLWIYNFGGSVFIGSDESEPAELLFDTPVYHVADRNNVLIARVQKLFID